MKPKTIFRPGDVCQLKANIAAYDTPIDIVGLPRRIYLSHNENIFVIAVNLNPREYAYMFVLSKKGLCYIDINTINEQSLFLIA